MELEIVEPTLMAGDLQPENRTLIYSITVSVIAAPDLLRGNRTSVHARLGPHPMEIAHVAPQDGATISSGALLRDGSVPLDGIQDPAASASPKGVSPPAIPRAAAGSGPEREASVWASPLADRAHHASAFSVGSLAQAIIPCAPRINEMVVAVLRKAQHDNFEDENTSEGIKANPDGPNAEPVVPSTIRVQDEPDCTADTLAGSDPTSQPSSMVEASTWSPNLEAAWSSEDPITTPPKSRFLD
ncbi:hypothetical protein BAE44_0010705 [Dichanthelium oligosanthes]|uniref:Uncharacterized protein n=1 Tax=Dichanthelium oligosanthes TaxID=888268 RepID=A0A1E5VT29_9POAL|nr:hypothetical protein BAE44_0010705 [Dichanthelium oligosanthes]